MTHLQKIVTFILCSIVFTHAFSQTKHVFNEPKQYTIAGITVEGAKNLQHAPIIQTAGLQVGQKILIPGPQITLVIDKLWQQDLFSDVKVYASKIEGDAIYLTIFVQERARLNTLEITGVKKSEQEDIRELINFNLHMQVNENKKNIALKKIKDFYIEKGFYNVDVTITETIDTSSFNRSDVVIAVAKNERVKIQSISFTDNSAFKDAKLRRFMKSTKRKAWYILKRSKYVPSLYETDKEKIIEKYKKQGYRDAEIIKDSVFFIDSTLMAIEISMHEGTQYFFRSISWIGNSIYSTEILERLLNIQAGDIYDEAHLQERIYGLDGVSSIYLDNGYLFFNAEPIEVHVENDSVDIQIRMYEGPQAVINKIIVQGNTKTNDHVIYREIRTKPGSLFSRSDIIRTQRELAMLGYFDPETMGINPKPNPEDGTVDIEYVLQEKSNDQIELSGGWSGSYLIGSVRLVLNNFSTRNMFKGDYWKPIPSGDGQQISLNASANPRWYQYYSFSFTEPWFGGKKPNALSFTTYYSIRANGAERKSSSYGSWKTVGITVGLQKSLEKPDNFFTLYNDLSAKKYILNKYSFGLPAAFPDSITTKSIALGTSFGRNSIDQPLYPRRGSMFSVRLELTPPHSLFRDNTDEELTQEIAYKWIEYHKWTFRSKMYTQIVDKLVLETRLDFGFLAYYNKNFRSPFESFDMGGDGLSNMTQYGIDIIPLRGYGASSLTPASGGNIFNKFSLELRYPLTLKPEATIYGLVFAEGGNVWSEFENYNPFNIKRSAGFGIRVFIPMMGLLGFDFGYGFDRLDSNPNALIGGWHPSFVLGQQF